MAGVPAVAEPVRQVGVLIERANGRAMEIMSALEFQDLTAQKVQRTFAVLEEVLVRLAKIQRLVDAGDVPAAPPRPVTSTPDGKTGQRLADELLVVVRPIDLGRIEERDAAIERCARQRDHRAAIRRNAVGVAHAHAPEPQCRDLGTVLSELSRIHRAEA
jgi:hypothetical protein